MLVDAGQIAARLEAERATPLSLHLRAAREDASGGAHLVEYSAGGDRVPARLWPASTNKAPLVVLQTDAGGSADDDAHAEAIATLRGAGLAVMTIDWPLHGARRSVKLSDRLQQALASNGDDPNGAVLVEQLVMQAMRDLGRGLDAAGALPHVDPARIALAGVGLGADLCLLYAAADPRPAALALAPGGRPGIDVPALLAGLGERPALLLLEKGRREWAALEGDPRVEWRAAAGASLAGDLPARFAGFLGEALGAGG